MRKFALLIPLAVALAATACNSNGGGETAAGVTGGGARASGEAAPPLGGKQSGSGGGKAASSVVPDVGPQVIQTASLRLSVPQGTFRDKLDAAHQVADSFGGFIVGSSVSQGVDRRLVEGSLVLRIPARSYNTALARLEDLGKIESLEENGQDVSQEFVDLNARVRQLQAVEAQLLELLKRANDVPAALAVQSQLSQVQLDLEQARGRLNYLDDQVTYATISLSLHEAGIVPPKGDDGFSIVDAWATAGSAFLTVVGWIFVGIAVAAPVIVLLVLGLLLGRVLRKRFAHA
jgi:hypothetical protein